MTPGVTLMVIGAILTFAIRAQPSGIDLRVVGLIFMLAGAGLIWHARRGARHERVITRVQSPEEPQDPASPIREARTIRETIRDRDVE